MVRRSLRRFATILAAALSPAFCAFLACSSDDSESGDGGDESASAFYDTYQEGPDFCDSFDGAGSPCAPVSSAICFPVCEAGGCSCVAGPKGTGVWSCQTDLSCVPKCSPEDASCVLDGGEFADTGPIPDSFVLPMYDATSDASSETGANDREADALGTSDAGLLDASSG